MHICVNSVWEDIGIIQSDLCEQCVGRHQIIQGDLCEQCVGRHQDYTE
jgi:DnaJ-class molecular chaperone